MLFLTIAEFKTQTGAKTISIVKSPKTNLLFANTDNGKNFKVQQAIDVTKPIKFMYEDAAKFGQGCITNVTEANPPIAVL